MVLQSTIAAPKQVFKSGLLNNWGRYAQKPGKGGVQTVQRGSQFHTFSEAGADVATIIYYKAAACALHQIE